MDRYTELFFEAIKKDISAHGEQVVLKTIKDIRGEGDREFLLELFDMATRG